MVREAIAIGPRGRVVSPGRSVQHGSLVRLQAKSATDVSGPPAAVRAGEQVVSRIAEFQYVVVEVKGLAEDERAERVGRYQRIPFGNVLASSIVIGIGA